MSDAVGSAESPCNVLRSEHRTIERVLRVLGVLVAGIRSGAGVETTGLADCIRFFRQFADACHHGKEEELLFPVLEARGIPRENGPIGVMLHEHRIGRGLVGQMAESLDAYQKGDADAAERCAQAAMEFISVLSQHIRKEDHVLFVMGDRVMSPTDQRQLAEGFCQVSCRHFDGQTRQELESLAASLEARWPVTKDS